MVSVVLPTYDRAAFLREAVETVLNQTYSNIELIIVDDGSTEDQEKFLRGWTHSYRLIRQNKNGGVSSARNRGIMEAKGDYIAFLDSDDLWDKRKIRKQVEQMESLPDIFIGHTDEIWIRGGIRVNPMKKHEKLGGSIFLNCLRICLISPSSVIVRRELFDKVGLFDEFLPACEDYDFWLRVTKDYLVDFVKEKLITKRGGHSDQLSHKYWGMDRFRIRSIGNLLRNGSLSPEQKRDALTVFRKKCMILSDGSRKRGHEERARKYTEMAEWSEKGAFPDW